MNLQYAIIPIGEQTSVANVFASKVEEDRISWALYHGDEASKGRDFVGHIWKNFATLELCDDYYTRAAKHGHYPVFGGRHMRRWPVRPGIAAAAGSVGR